MSADLDNHARALAEAHPSLDELYREVYGRLTAADRRRIREARSEAAKAEVEAERKRRQNACTCPLCLAEKRGDPQGTRHGEHASRAYGCRCTTCRTARKASERLRKRLEASSAVPE